MVGAFIEKHRILKEILIFLVIAAGAALYAAGFQFFMFPNSIPTGGVGGIAMIINRLCGLPVGLLTFLMNVPLFIMARKYFGNRFFLGSLAGVAISSAFIDLFAMSGYVATRDMLLACICGGFVKGGGLGFILYMGGSTGGIDILAKIFQRKYPHYNIGTMLMWMDVCVIFAYALMFSLYESAMYALVAMFVVSKVVDLVIYGFNTSALCYIISENSENIVEEIFSGNIHRGVTLLDGQGAYSRKEKQIIMCVVKRSQITELRRIVRRVDERAFVIVTDAKNVFGNGFDNILEEN